MWPSQIVEDSPRFMSQLRASVASPDRRIIPRFKLGKYWSRGLQWLASRPEMEGNRLLCRVQKNIERQMRGKNKTHYLNNWDWWHKEWKTNGSESRSFLSVNSSHRNVGGFKCQLSSFIKANAPPLLPALTSITLPRITGLYGEWCDGGGSYLEPYSFQLDTILSLSKRETNLDRGDFYPAAIRTRHF